MVGSKTSNPYTYTRAQPADHYTADCLCKCYQMLNQTILQPDWLARRLYQWPPHGSADFCHQKSLETYSEPDQTCPSLSPAPRDHCDPAFAQQRSLGPLFPYHPLYESLLLLHALGPYHPTHPEPMTQMPWVHRPSVPWHAAQDRSGGPAANHQPCATQKLKPEPAWSLQCGLPGQGGLPRLKSGSSGRSGCGPRLS